MCSAGGVTLQIADLAFAVLAAAVETTILAVAAPNNPNAESNDYNRIVHREAAEPGQFPHMVSLRDNVFNKHFCGGSIMCSTWVLSPAHCVVGIRIDYFDVVTGNHFSNVDGTLYCVSQVEWRAEYSPKTLDKMILLSFKHVMKSC